MAEAVSLPQLLHLTFPVKKLQLLCWIHQVLPQLWLEPEAGMHLLEHLNSLQQHAAAREHHQLSLHPSLAGRSMLPSPLSSSQTDRWSPPTPTTSLRLTPRQPSQVCQQYLAVASNPALTINHQQPSASGLKPGSKEQGDRIWIHQDLMAWGQSEPGASICTHASMRRLALDILLHLLRDLGIDSAPGAAALSRPS